MAGEVPAHVQQRRHRAHDLAQGVEAEPTVVRAGRCPPVSGRATWVGSSASSGAGGRSSIMSSMASPIGVPCRSRTQGWRPKTRSRSVMASRSWRTSSARRQSSAGVRAWASTAAMREPAEAAVRMSGTMESSRDEVGDRADLERALGAAPGQHERRSLLTHARRSGQGHAAQGERARSAHLAAGPAHAGRVVEAELREALEPHRQRDLQLHAGQVGSGAAVDAEAERGVAVLGPVDDDLVGPLEELGVPVGRRERQQHPVVLAHGAALELEVVDDESGHGDGRVGPQQLLDRGRDQLGLGHQAGPVVGVAGQVPERRADGAPGGVDAGDQQQCDGAAHVARARAAVRRSRPAGGRTSGRRGDDRCGPAPARSGRRRADRSSRCAAPGAGRRLRAPAARTHGTGRRPPRGTRASWRSPAPGCSGSTRPRRRRRRGRRPRRAARGSRPG